MAWMARSCGVGSAVCASSKGGRQVLVALWPRFSHRLKAKVPFRVPLKTKHGIIIFDDCVRLLCCGSAASSLVVATVSEFYSVLNIVVIIISSGTDIINIIIISLVIIKTFMFIIIISSIISIFSIRSVVILISIINMMIAIVFTLSLFEVLVYIILYSYIFFFISPLLLLPLLLLAVGVIIIIIIFTPPPPGHCTWALYVFHIIFHFLSLLSVFVWGRTAQIVKMRLSSAMEIKKKKNKNEKKKTPLTWDSTLSLTHIFFMMIAQGVWRRLGEFVCLQPRLRSMPAFRGYRSPTLHCVHHPR